jgi:metacaspase-1
MLILMDDGRHHPPTRKNILDAFDRIVQYSKAGDCVFVHYSGHGGRIRDTSGDEADGYDEVSGSSGARLLLSSRLAWKNRHSPHEDMLRCSAPYNQTLIPVDFQKAGQIVDDDLYKHLVKSMPAGVTVTVLMDCCHSGSALDLPYEINATQSKMSYNQGFNAGLLDDPVQMACCAICLVCLLGELLGGAFDG